MIKRLCIIGVGLIGGSLARALRAAGACGEVVGAGRNADHLQQAVDLGVIDRFETDMGTAVRGADMVCVSVPLGAMGSVFGAIKNDLSADAVLTDAGSAKGSVIDAARQVFGEVPANLVPGHPIAGTERSGVAASMVDLYLNRRVILTPLPHTDAAAVARVRRMWEAVGAIVDEMEPEHHDEVLAATSHLPHVLAFALVESLARLQDKREIFEYAAGGFRDFTRIASSDPGMWRDICIANGDAILHMIERFSTDLQVLADAVRAHDSDRLLGIFTAAKQARDAFVDVPVAERNA
ncbi:MAG: prephenate dehydrogenase/arogenate dehydrogenase family protein [Thiohalobacterales bacterium]|nr:prephenate dehydrogenase/arogenate dehydrogenase family protein [Thiohalobacterales bacterium]